MGARVIQRTDVFYYIYRIVCISGGAKDKIADVFLQNSEFCKISMCKILSNGKIFVAGLLRLQEKIIQIAASFLTVPGISIRKFSKLSDVVSRESACLVPSSLHPIEVGLPCQWTNLFSGHKKCSAIQRNATRTFYKQLKQRRTNSCSFSIR